MTYPLNPRSLVGKTPATPGQPTTDTPNPTPKKTVSPYMCWRYVLENILGAAQLCRPDNF